MSALHLQPVPTIVVVEDDPDTREMLDMVLGDVGYQTFLWPRGKDAHLKIREIKPALVILDMRLEAPNAGEMVLGLMRLDPATQRIPVIVCSTGIQELRARRPQLEGHGCVLMEKPFELAELLETITTLLGTPASPPSQDPGDP